MMVLGRSELQMRRALLAALAAFALIGLVSTQTVVGRLDPVVLPAWYRLVFVVGFLVPVLAALVGLVVGRRALHRLTVLAFAGAVTPVGALLVLAIADPGLEGQLPWMISSSAAAGAVAVLAWGSRAGWWALGAITIANWTISALVGDLVPHRVSNDTQALLFAALAVLLVGALVRSSAAVDRAAASGLRAAERRAADLARRSASERTRAFVHDEVLGTLLQAARGTPEADALIATQAATAAARVRELAEPEVTGEVAIEELHRRLDELARLESPGSTCTARVGPDAPTSLPAAVALSLVAASRQALVNAARHAPGSSVTLSMVAGMHGVRIVIADDGPGFAPAEVAPDRLGISASILGRLRAVPGGDARVESTAGVGTVVTLEWRDDPATPERGPRRAADDAVATDPVRAPARLDGEPRAALIVLLVAVTALAIYSAAIVAEPWIPAFAIVLVLVGLGVLGWTPVRRPSLPRSAVAVLLAIGTASLVAAGPIVDYRMMTGWYATAAAFVMVVLALRGRPRLSMVGTVSGVALAAVLSAARGASIVDIVSVLFRPVLIGIGVALVVLLLAALASRVRRLDEAEVAAASRDAWREAERSELLGRWAELERVIGPTLDRLAEGRTLSADERRECALVEGAIRDLMRGTRLAREPLASAARRARARGVDVVLLDDAREAHIDDGELVEIATWLATILDEVPSGAFTGRILPADRPGRASATSDTTATLFRGSDAYSPG